MAPEDPRDRRIAELEALVAKLMARIQELEAQVNRNSGNSSKPPSSDAPGAPERPKQVPTGRKRGGQPGHDKHERALLPPERVRSVSDCLPDACRRCGDALHGIDADPTIHQVLDIPRLIALADEFRIHSLHCDRCGITTQGQLPEGVPTTGISPRFEAVIGMLSGKYRLSKRSVQELCGDVFDADIALGSVCNAEQRVSEAIAAPVAEAHEAVKAAAVVHADETSWREARKKAWLWVATTATIAVFLVRGRRDGAAAKELLGERFAGFLVTDRWVSYNFVNYLRRQLCWAHLKRDFASFLEYGPEAKRIGRELEDARERLFAEWYRARDGRIKRATLIANTRPIQREILDLLREGIHCPSKKVAGMCREILEAQHSLFVFIAHEGIEPTNNHAEQTIRHAVIWRKTSFGTDSESGSRFVERVLTVVQTLRLQKRCVLDYLTTACEARLRGQAAPSLIAA